MPRRTRGTSKKEKAIPSAQVVPLRRRPPPGTYWYGGPVDRTRARVRFYGDELDPDEMTRALGAKPTRTRRKGEIINGRPWAHRSNWILESKLEEKAEPEEHIWHLFSKLTDDLRVWRRLTRRFKGDLFVAVFLDAMNRGLLLSPRLQTAIGARGLSLGIDIYCPEKPLHPEDAGPPGTQRTRE